jgi:hypothetical protein
MFFSILGVVPVCVQVLNMRYRRECPSANDEPVQLCFTLPAERRITPFE